jgi:hypothetical protein
MLSKDQKLSSRHLWLTVVLVWTLVALFHYVQFYFQHVNQGSTFLWLPTLVEFVANYYSWVAIAVFVIWLGRRYRFQAQRWHRSLLVHLLACVTLALLHLGLVAILLKTFKGFSFKSFTLADFYVYVFLWLFHFEVLMYWAVLGLSYGFEYYTASQRIKASERSESHSDASGSRYWEKLLIKDNGSTILLRTGQVDWLEAADNYVQVYCGPQSYLLRERMHILERKLDPRCFQRIHRSIIVNLARIQELKRGDKGEYEVVLRDDTHLQVSRRRRDTLRVSLMQLAKSRPSSPTHHAQTVDLT